MRRLIPLLLLFSTLGFAQVVVTNSGFATSPGPAVIAAQPFVPLAVTPSVDLTVRSVSPMGASSQVGNNQVGATSFPIYLPPQSMAITVPIYSNLNPAYAGPAMSLVAPMADVQPGMAAPFDVGVGRASDLMLRLNNYGPSLADVAARYRNQQVTPGHVYTNDDLRRLSSAGSSNPPAASSTSASNLGNAPAIDNNSRRGPITFSHGVVSNAAPSSNSTTPNDGSRRSPFKRAPGKKAPNDSQPH